LHKAANRSAFWNRKVFGLREKLPLFAILFAVWTFTATTKLARSQNAPTTGAQTSGGSVIRSEADLVVLPVSVRDRSGHFVSGLQQQDFRIYENGKPQPIRLFMSGDAPVTVGLIIDCSSSMRENHDEVVEAAKDFLASSNPQDQVFVVNFNETPLLGLPRGVPFTSNVSALVSAVQTAPSDGMTALYDAINLGLKHLSLGTNQKKALVIISDGGDDASETTLKKTLPAVQRSSTIVYTIGLVASDQADVNPGVLRKFAGSTGGEVYFPRSNQLPGISQQIARDLREQYTLAFLPAGNAKGYRKIRVTVNAPGHRGLKVRTRPGYLASANPPAKSTN
jgi:Ca-activated chloride channel homolog